MNRATVRKGCRLDETTRRRYLEAMGIDVWYLKGSRATVQQTPSTKTHEKAIHSTNDNSQIADEMSPLELSSWLKEQCIKNFQLDSGPVQYLGDLHSNILVLSDSKKSDGDTGQPFCEKNGVLLRSMLRSVGLDLTSVIVCELSNNKSEANSLDLFTKEKSISTIVFLVNPDNSNLSLNQEVYSKPLVDSGLHAETVFTIHHPDYLLLNPSAKSQAWSSFKKIKTELSKT